MKMTNIVTVTGMKRSKGEYEGTAYDSTKFYIESDLDASKGNACGRATSDFTIGTSTEYDKYPHAPDAFPYQAEADFEIVTSGKETKLQLTALRPKQRVSQAKAA